MGCGTNIVPGYKEFNKKAKKIAPDTALEMKVSQLMSVSKPKPKKKS
jgi:hypothetical protein|tara:strand:+ start:10 stop:150 length:141 start_codon:yes stop_codon:yes gene_type:complete